VVFGEAVRVGRMAAEGMVFDVKAIDPASQKILVG
jgi:hypothetical protein